MVRLLPETLQFVPKLIAQMPEADAALFMKLINQSLTNEVVLGTKERRVVQREIQTTLDNEGVDNAASLASNLVDIRITENIIPYIPLLTHEKAEEFVGAAYKLGQLKVNMDSISSAADKTARIVQALKSYSHVQQNDELIAIDLKLQLEDIFTLFNSQLKQGIQLVKSFDIDLPKVAVYPDELGQVWTNIIQNGIQAMKGQGILSVGTRKDAGYAVVSITDAGSGIPPEILPRIFEPFFSTKQQGEGTGLGLDICKRIVEKHSGKITVESVPGRTTFSVYLPLHTAPTQV
jgi:signal transduction histidine kinase